MKLDNSGRLHLLKKQVGRCGLDKETGWKMWSGFIWLKMKTIGGLVNAIMNFSVLQTVGNFLTS
jgi:hypothetical protein